MTTKISLRDRATDFLESIQHRLNIEFDQQHRLIQSIKQDTGAKAILKRALNEETRSLRNVYPIVERSLDRVGIKLNLDDSYKRDQWWIFVACLFAEYPQPISRGNKQNFGHSCWFLQQEIRRVNPDAKGVERRFHALLDTSLEDLRSPLTSLLRHIKSKDISGNQGIAINYPQLIVDLCGWEHSDQYVQDNWARAFWGAPPKLSEDPEEAIDEDIND